MIQDREPSLDVYVKAALGRKAENPVILDVKGLSSVADTFIICSGRSNRQVKAIGTFIKEELKKHKITALHVEGMQEGHWVLMDYGHVIIHVFYEPVRNFYDLEGLWMDAKRVKTESLIQMEHALEVTSL